MAVTEITYKGRRIWLDLSFAGKGWRVEAEVWEVGKEGIVKEEIRLPANYYCRSPRAALAFVKRMTQRGIEQRQRQAGAVPTTHGAL
jgi:hypothetical protein